MAQPDKGKSGKGGMDIVIGLGPPPKLGQRDKVPRPMSSDAYRGSASPGDPGEEVASAGDGDGDENMFDQNAAPDELLVGAAHDVMSAFHARDAEAVAAALQSFVQMAAG